jgi:ABC-2 type transport system ATP-binding protein
VKDAFARERVLTVQTETAAALDDVRAALPQAEITAGETPLQFSMRFDRFAMTAGQAVTAVAALVNLVDFGVEEPSIEDVIRRVYSGELQLGTA